MQAFIYFPVPPPLHSRLAHSHLLPRHRGQYTLRWVPRSAREGHNSSSIHRSARRLLPPGSSRSKERSVGEGSLASNGDRVSGLRSRFKTRRGKLAWVEKHHPSLSFSHDASLPRRSSAPRGLTARLRMPQSSQVYPKPRVHCASGFLFWSSAETPLATTRRIEYLGRSGGRWSWEVYLF